MAQVTFSKACLAHILKSLFLIGGWKIGGGCWSPTPGLITCQNNRQHKQGGTLVTGFWQVLQLFYFDQLESVQTVCGALGNRLSLACEFWHPGPGDHGGGGGWKSTWQCLQSPTSCWWHPPLADSESPTACCLPSPAARQPIRPGSPPPMLTSFARSHTCAQGGGNPNEQHRAAAAAGASASASKARPAAGQPSVTGCSYSCPGALPQDGAWYELQTGLFEPKSKRVASLGKRNPWKLSLGTCPVYS